MDTLQIIISILGAVGISSVITAIMTKKKEIAFRLIEEKQRRYKCSILFMQAYLEPENIRHLKKPTTHTKEDVMDDLKAEWYDMSLYASREVVIAVRQFIEIPSTDRFSSVLLEMRKDLWIKRKDLSLRDILLNSSIQNV